MKLPAGLWMPSLRARLALLVIVACVLPQCFAEYMALRRTHEQLITARQEQLAARADQIVSEFDSIHRSYQRAVRRIAQRQDIVAACSGRRARSGEQRERIKDLLDSFPATDANVSLAAVIDGSGQVLAATDRALEGRDVSMHGAVRTALSGRPLVAGISMSATLQGDRAGVAYLAPVRDGARTACAVGLWVHADLFWRELRASNDQAGSGSYATLLDATGVRIAHTLAQDAVFHPAGRLDVVTTDKLAAEARFGPRTRELLGQVLDFPEQFTRALAPQPDASPFRGVSPTQQAWTMGVGRRLSSVDWTVFYLAPEAELAGALAQATQARLLFGGGILAVTLALALLLAGRILRSVRTLTEATAALAGGDTAVRVPPLGRDEFGRLGEGFNAMAARIHAQASELKSANETLEQRVQARTRESNEAAARLADEMREHSAAEVRDRQHQRLLQAILDNSGAVIWAQDAAGRFMLVNNRFCELFGLELDAVIGRTAGDVAPAAAAQGLLALQPDVISAGEPVIREEGLAQPDGPHTYLTVQCPLRDTAGAVMGAVGIATDITERKREHARTLAHLERLKQLEQITTAIGERQDLGSIYQVATGSLEDSMALDFSCICTYDAAGRMLRVVHLGRRSQALLDRLPLSAGTLVPVDANGLGPSVRGQLVYEPDVGTSGLAFTRRLARGGLRSLVLAPLAFEGQVFGVLVAARRSANAFSSGDCEFMRQLSSHVALAAHQAQLYDDLRAAYDDLRLTQESALQQERLSALGQMASGIAHDINNAISPVALYTEALLEREPGLSERARGYLQIIARSIEDVAATVSRMREFSRLREPAAQLAPLALNDLARQVLELTQARWRDMAQQQGIVIDVQTALAEGLPPVMGVESEVREALLNLVFNALDAMPTGGTLALRSHLSDDGRHVDIDVSDSGAGMSEEVRRRCFEPFFTTKGERGTGLGLAMVYGVMQRADASVSVDSAPGQGTTVRLSFPVPLQDAPALPAPADASVLPPPMRILVVDDDPTLLRSLCESLRADGHAVTDALGGEAGIQTFRAQLETPQAFDAVFTDLGMPRVGGREVAAAIRAMSATVRIILLTGWGQRLADQADTPPGVDLVLSKPARIRELRAALVGPGANAPAAQMPAERSPSAAAPEEAPA
jgi:PAS domain S-box-containing protein